jgi:hypothetical protein
VLAYGWDVVGASTDGGAAAGAAGASVGLSAGVAEGCSAPVAVGRQAWPLSVTVPSMSPVAPGSAAGPAGVAPAGSTGRSFMSFSLMAPRFPCPTSPNLAFDCKFAVNRADTRPYTAYHP